MSLSPWFILLASVPVLLLGEFLCRRIGFLRKYNIPAPVVGGLLISVLLLCVSYLGIEISLQTKVTEIWWKWILSTPRDFGPDKSVEIAQPFMVSFFACIGLNASGSLAKKAGSGLGIFLLLCALLTTLQNIVGVSLASLLGQSPLLGLICGSLALTGGHGTALGFADTLVKSGYESAHVVGVAAATFGLVAGGLIGGPVASGLIRKFKLLGAYDSMASTEPEQSTHTVSNSAPMPTGFLTELKELSTYGRSALLHLAVVACCLKLGAFVSLFVVKSGLSFPVYIGAMIVGVLFRNLMDLTRVQRFQTHVFDLIGSVCLGIFLSIAMMSLQLQQLGGSVASMLIILTVQVAMMVAFARFITFRLMGNDYDSAVMAAGHCGFGLGATPTAVANMKSLVDAYGPAPRAFLIVPLVGAFLIDFINTLVITGFLNWLD
ncbi:MAG: sodium/glutamate symporter [Myxococcales bacterium]|nr:MAG: sodium/glutamate symporter [Myxococcales bacterium]